MSAGPEADTECVVLESALGCPCTEWVVVQQELATAGVRSIAYDRPGIGWSQAARRADSPGEHAEHLASLLRQLNARRIVLVGHSVGALLARSYWRRAPSTIVAMVLVDGSHPDQHRRSSRQSEGLRTLQTRLRSARRNRAETPFEGEVALLPRPFGEITHNAATDPAAVRATEAELSAWLASWSQDAALTTDLDGLPLTVLTAGDVIRRDPAHRLLQTELLGLSTSATHEIFDDATHQGIVMDPRFAKEVAAHIIDSVRRR